ncbi:MAG: ABC transporter substrate-binding protein [Gammaproteobacteria bacterium]|nr:ABC transporter substrate-binding protein [Gammaproteobacteria bacterium]
MIKIESLARKLPESPGAFKIPGSIGRVALFACLLTVTIVLSGCSRQAWNDPYRAGEAAGPIFYSSFSERPKHLDPARSYSANEWAFISQVYEPPLQYHFLKRPYELVPLTADALPEIRQYASDGTLLPDHAPASDVAYTDYIVRIRPGIRYQPHPALARNDDGSFVYWPLDDETLDRVDALADFERTGSRELVAADYLYQIKRLAFSPNHSPVASLMAEHIRGFADFSERAKAAHDALPRQGGMRPWLDLRGLDMSGLAEIDRYTYRVRIENKYPQFIYWLAMNFFAPMPWEAERFYHQPGLDEKNINLHWYPIGTGPFMLTENNPNLRMVLVRNPNFHGETYPVEGSDEDRRIGLLDDAGREMPFIERAVYSLEKEAIPRWNKFLQGFYDNSGIGSDSFDQAVQFGSGGEATLTEAMRERGIRLSTAVETSLFYTGFNMRDPVVGGDSERARLLRQAIAIAIDFEEFISIFRNGRGEAAQGPLPPGIFGHRSGESGVNPVTHEWRNGTPRRRSIDDARQLMVEAGYTDGRDPATGGPLILYYDTPAAGPDSKAMLQWYRKQLAKLGVELVIRATDYNRFQDKMLKGTSQIFSWGWNADYPDPENFFFLLYGPNGKVESKGENAANFRHPEFDALFVEMKDMENGPARQQVIDRMVEILRVESPWLFGFYPKAYSLHHSWYRNAKPHLMANNTLKYKGVDGTSRIEAQSAWNDPVLWPLGVLLAILIVSIIPAVRGFRARERSRAL